MSSRKSSQMKQRLLAERDQLLREREALDNQISGLERAIALVANDSPTGSALTNTRRGAIKAMVLDLLDEAGTMGINAATAVEMANRRGMTLEKASVSSILSRFKADGVAIHGGDKYRLAKFAPKPEAPHQHADRANIVGLEQRRG